jgi:RNA polymerase sigma-70 factor (ECF subfamily)
MTAARGQVMTAHHQGPPWQTSAQVNGPSGTAAATVDGALLALHRRYSKQLFHYVVRLTLGDARQAEDVMQETFVRAWSHLKQHRDTDLEGFAPWLYTVARRIVVDMVRARRARPVEVIVNDFAQLSAADDGAADDGIGQLVTGLAVREALKRLHPRHRTLLVDLFYHGRTAAEVAKKLNIPIGTVKSRTFNAKRALRFYLHQQGYDSTLTPAGITDQAG